MTRLTSKLSVLTALALLVAPATVDAERLANPDLLQVRSVQDGKRVWRVSLAGGDAPALVVELLSRSGKSIDRRDFKAVSLGGNRVLRAAEIADIGSIERVGSRLEVILRDGSSSVGCDFTVGRSHVGSAECRVIANRSARSSTERVRSRRPRSKRRSTRSRVPREWSQPEQDRYESAEETRWSDVPSVRAACDRIATSRQHRDDCLAAVAVSEVDPRPAIQACSDAMDDDRMKLDCVRHALTARDAAVSLVLSCAAAFDGDEPESLCIRMAKRHGNQATAVVEACASGMTGDKNELACIRGSVGAPSAARMIEACELVMDGDDNELRCIEAASRSRHSAKKIVEFCEAAMDGDENELQCIRVASAAQRDPAPVIRRCGDVTRDDDEALTCLERGTRRRRTRGEVARLRRR